MANSSRKVLHTYSEISIFCGVMKYIEPQELSVGGAFKVLRKSLKRSLEEDNLEEILFVVNLYSSFLAFWSPQANPSFIHVSHLPPPKQNKFENSPSSRHINNSLNVYLFLDSEPQRGKSEEFNNQGTKEVELLEAIPFLSSKKQKKSDRLCVNFFSNLNTSVQRCLSSLVQRPLLLLPPLF